MKNWKQKFSFREYLLPIFSSVGGNTGVFLNTLGLIRINASIYQMLRGALTIFSTLFAILFLKRKLHKYEITGLIMTVISLIVVGIAGVQMDSDVRFTWQDRIIGCSLIILAQVIQGAQLVYDEFMLKNYNLPVLFVVGMEGVWGLLIDLMIAQPLCLIIPGDDPSPLGGSLETGIDCN